MFAVLKELSGFIYSMSAVRGGETKKLIECSRNAAFRLHILNCISKSFSECRKIIISSPNCFYVKLHNQDLWREKITCRARNILRDCTFRKWEQNVGNESSVAWWADRAQDPGPLEMLRKLTTVPRPHRNQQLSPDSLNSQVITAKV